MAEERNIYRVAFPVEDGPLGQQVSMEVSALPFHSPRTVVHQVWLLLSRQGYDLDPTMGSIEKVGTEMVTHD
ncbi:hypothetical protein [Streptomyces wuyuanensis]|uniref:hypothetical protein n=1 Tax=Streptomyces wuyuanensis TaxID=1196353 RepID=UPI00343F2857